jgi:DnaJ-class molecular chaperone
MLVTCDWCGGSGDSLDLEYPCIQCGGSGQINEEDVVRYPEPHSIDDPTYFGRTDY